jgi:membrane protein YqaA with SNARE-associated domain
VHRLSGALFALILKFGGFGLLVLGVLDSSFLFAPLGNDVLVIAMVARHPGLLPILYYAGMSTIGSVVGCLIVDVPFRKAGEKGLERQLSPKRLQYVRTKLESRAVLTLTVASIAPPPFPFTPFVAAAAALEYSRRRLLTIVGLARMFRFVALGVLALSVGPRLLRLAANPIVQDVLIAGVVIFTVGSALSLYGWIKRSRSVAGTTGCTAGRREKTPASNTDKP